mgnify:CR=1 FL=1
MVGQVLTAFPFAIAAAQPIFPGVRPMSGGGDRQPTFNDLRKLTLAFVMLWAYSVLFTVSDHLVRKPARRNALLHQTPHRRMAVLPTGVDSLPLCAALLLVVVARSLQSAAAPRLVKVAVAHPLDALCGFVHASYSGRPSFGGSFLLDGSGGTRWHRRIVAVRLPAGSRKPASVAGSRSALCGGFGKWTLSTVTEHEPARR